MIRLEGVSKTYGGFTAVHPLDLHVRRGELFGFLGPNGAGKTTTMRMVTGVLRPTAGRIHVAGCDMVADPVAAKRHVGYIPDRPALYEKLTGGEFLRFTSGLWGRSGATAEKRADELLALFDLSEWKDTLIESYSHGMRQKLLISSALVHSPDVLVVDEPMVGLDPRAARMIKDLLRAFADQGGTVFLSTHTLEVAEALCDRIAILQGGRIRAMGSMAQLRGQAAAGTAHLEDIFLKLTGGDDVREVVAALRNPDGPGTTATATAMARRTDNGGGNGGGNRNDGGNGSGNGGGNDGGNGSGNGSGNDGGNGDPNGNGAGGRDG